MRRLTAPPEPISALNAPASTGAIAMTANKITRMADCRNANVRPLVSSSTSRPITV